MTHDPHSISSQPSADLRIFISSTFRDLQEERELLVKKIFPEIRDLCRLRGVELTEVDLRWGIAEDESRPGRIIRTCLEEIDRCRPFFIGIVGDRFGWVPSSDVLEDDPSLMERYPWLQQVVADGGSITKIEFLYATLPSSSSDTCALFFRRFSDGAESNGERAELDRMVEATEQAGYRVASYHDPESLGRMIRSELIDLVERRWPIDRMPTPLEVERRKHEAFASTRRRAYIPNPRYLERFRAFLEIGRSEGDGGAGLVIQAASGAGKSSLISYLASHLAEIDPDAFAITHFIGAGSSDGDHTEVIRRIMSELRERFDLTEEIPTEPAEIERELPAWLARSRSRVVIFIDALDQLRPDPRGLAWLPRFLPANIMVVASTTGGESLEALRERGFEELVVQPLDVIERRALIDRFLGAYRKRLHPELAARIAADPKCAIPLFLRTVLEELRVFGEHERLEQTTGYYLDASDLSILFQRVLERMEQDFGAAFVREILTLVAVARRGLTETELIELSGATRVELSEILHALDYHLFRRQGRLDFFHAWLRRAVEERYLPDDGVTHRMHARLAEYFRHAAPSARLAEELPWQFQKADDLQGLRDAVGDIDLFPFLATEEMRYELLGYWRLLKERYDIVEIYRQSIGRYAAIQRDELKVAEVIDGVWEMLLLANYFDGVEPLLRQGYEASVRHLGEHHPDSIKRLSQMGELYHRIGEYEKAAHMLGSAVEAHRKLDSSDELSVADSMIRLAALHYDMNEYQKAEPLFREVLAIRERILGRDHGLTAKSLTDLGGLLLGLGQLEEAETVLRKALEITETVCGEVHEDTAVSANNLAALLIVKGRFEAATPLLHKTLDINERLFGPVHPTTATTLLNLGFVFKQQGDFDQAEQYYRRAIEINRRILGENNPAITSGMISLGNLLREKGDYQAALHVTLDAFDIRERAFGREHKDSIDAVLQVARIRGQLGDRAVALEMYRTYFPIRVRQLGSEHPMTVRSRGVFIDLLRASGFNDEADQLEKNGQQTTKGLES